MQEVANALQEYVDRTGDINEALVNLELIAQTIQRTGAAGVDIGRLFSQWRKGGIRGADDVREAVVASIESERQGALKFRDVARYGAEALSLHFAIPEMKGLAGWREFLTSAQLGMVGTADPAKTFTAMRAVGAAAQDPAKRREMEKLGVYGAERRSPLRVLEELLARVNGRVADLAHIYDMEARAIPSAASLEEGQDVLRRVRKGMEDADPTLFEKETAALAEQLSAKIQATRDRVQSLFSRALGGPMEDVGAAAFGMQDLILGGATAGLAGYGAWRGGRAVWRGARRWRGLDEPSLVDQAAGRGRRGSVPRGAAGVGGLGPIAQLHVTTLVAGRVVGGPGGGGGGSVVTGGGGKGRNAVDRAAGKGGILRRAAGRAGGVLSRFGGRVGLGGLGLAALGSVGAVSALSRGDVAGAAREGAGAGGALAGGMAGAATGAAIGSIVPLIGTTVGSIVGGILGSFTGSGLGESIVERFTTTDWNAEGAGRDASRAASRASFLERAAGRDEDEPSLVEQAAGRGRDARRNASRRRFLSQDERQLSLVEQAAGLQVGADGVVRRPGEAPEGQSPVEALIKSMREPARVVNNNGSVDQSVHIEAGAIAVHSETGDPQEIGEAVMEQIEERIRRRQRHDEERLLDITYSDPDPTLIF